MEAGIWVEGQGERDYQFKVDWKLFVALEILVKIVFCCKISMMNIFFMFFKIAFLNCITSRFSIIKFSIMQNIILTWFWSDASDQFLFVFLHYKFQNYGKYFELGVFCWDLIMLGFLVQVHNVKGDFHEKASRTKFVWGERAEIKSWNMRS